MDIQSKKKLLGVALRSSFVGGGVPHWERSYELGQDISKSREEYGGSPYQTTNSIREFGL